jgi:5-(carboxyamino)imidazole ribonucleotide synthase
VRATVGILGGGQLARMLAMAGSPLGMDFLVVDAAADACAGGVAPLLQADWRDRDALVDFARRVDVATFDFENVPEETARWLATRTRVFPNPDALAIAQDRLAEKRLFGEIGLATPAFAAVDGRADLDAAVATVGLPAVLKTRRLGYDGKGQRVLRATADLDEAWSALGGVPLILERFVAFDGEISVIAVRGRDGEFRTWPLTRNRHADGILSISVAPAPGFDAYAAAAFAHARALAERLDYVGVFALELFVAQDCLFGNEMAPRVHNSGHWTIEGAATSQFENHLRAVLGLPLGDTSARGGGAMLNFVGALPDATAVLATPDAHWHDYGKAPRPGRKVGHATIVAPSVDLLAERLEAMGRRLGRDDEVAAASCWLRARS